MVPDIPLGAGVPRLVSSIGSRACSVGVMHFLRFPLFSWLTLRTSMCPGRSSVLRIGSNSGV